MTMRLTASLYRDLCSLAEDALDHPNPLVQPVGSHCAWPVAVYLLGHRHPVSSKLLIDYVGSAVRLSTDVAARTREHLRNEAKRLRLTCQVIIPLRVDTALPEVRRLEGSVARALDVPHWCKRVPGGKR
ncbi:hypothetical protein AB0C12_24925 [Actinoplanes sp. NPDC048967]|uniref:hypothetical protein n=1 Tax=Actinoplanes sp. NPDC048967 TaxID=3155269 RepID=UPI0034021D40